MQPTQEIIELLNRFLGWQAKIEPMDETSKLYQGPIREFQILAGTVSTDRVLEISFVWMVERSRYHHWEPSMLSSDDWSNPRLNLQFKLDDQISFCPDSEGDYTLILLNERRLIHFYQEGSLGWIGRDSVAKLFDR